MHAVGIRELKNRLSEYLRLIAEGETVLVTDRGKVIAQLTGPPSFPSAVQEDAQAALERLARAGVVTLATRSFSADALRPLEGVPVGTDLGTLLDELRADRYEPGR